MDAFAGLDGLKAPPKREQSLSEQRKQQTTQRSTFMDDLDILSGSIPPTAKQPTISGSTAKHNSTSYSTPIPSKVVKEDDDDIFGIFNSAPPPKAAPESSSKSTLSSDSKFDVSSYNEHSFTENQEAQPDRYKHTGAENGDIRSRISSRNTSQVRSTQPMASAPKYDREIAQMVDMGFEPADSKRALKAMDGNTRGAVNWLMAEAQGLPLPEPPRKSSKIGGIGGLASTDFNSLQNQASQIGASMFSKASSLFSKGRKEIEKAYNQYSGDVSVNNPAWMRDKEKYDAMAANIPDRRSGLDKGSTMRSGARDGNVDELPQRPRRHNVSSSTSNPSGSGFSEQPDQPVQRVSRAELFRQKQKERQNAAAGNSGSSTRDATPEEASSLPKEAPEEPAIDLLNIASSDTATSTLSSTQTDLYSASKELGTKAFKSGNYESAVEHYTAALSIVPEDNLIRAVLLSNRSAALVKSGNLRAAFEDTEAGVKMLPQGEHGLVIEGASMGDIWVKLVTRNAQVAEQMEKFSVALRSWQLLLDNGHASPSVLAAKRRCNTALNPVEVAKAQQSDEEHRKAQPPKSQRRGWGTTGAQPTSAAGKEAVAKVKEHHKQQADEERQRDLLREKISQRVDNWKKGKEGQLPALLSTLQDVLWSDCQWNPVSATDLVVPKKVKIVYMKAVAKTHPDKVPNSASVEVRMISQNVFVILQEAWEIFRQKNNI